MKVLVCGAGGSIGHHLVRSLKEMGYWVRGADVKKPEYSESEADEFLEVDLRNTRNCQEAVQGVERIYQLAADMGGMGFISSQHAIPYQNSLRINLNMADVARMVKARILFSSSVCAYPTYLMTEPSTKPIGEDEMYPALPNENYGWEKLTAEHIYQAYAKDYGLDIRIARYDNTYGEETTFVGGREKAPAAICRKVLQATDTIDIWGDGKQTRAFLHVSDNVKATISLMESDVREPVNVASNELVSIDELVDVTCAIAGKKLKKSYQLDKPQGVRGRLIDTTKIRKLFGWEPQVSLKEGMTKLHDWMKTVL